MLLLRLLDHRVRAPEQMDGTQAQRGKDDESEYALGVEAPPPWLAAVCAAVVVSAVCERRREEVGLATSAGRPRERANHEEHAARTELGLSWRPLAVGGGGGWNQALMDILRRGRAPPHRAETGHSQIRQYADRPELIL